MSASNHHQQTGFTLVEMIMVIVITGIIGGIVAVFLKAPIQQYMDVARRAELTDIADTAVRRMARDVRIAVPNSIRVPDPAGVSTYVEFLPTKDGGRYRTGAPDNTLEFNEVDNSFDFIGTANVDVGDYVVIGSTQTPDSIAYETTLAGRLRQVNGVSGVAEARTGITIDLGFPTPAELEARRFAVVDGGPVTYACIVPEVGPCPNDPNVTEGTCQLVRYSGYTIRNEQTLVLIQAEVLNPPILADRVSACEITYEVPNQRFGLLAVRLTLTSGGESVTLYNEIHVNNAP